MIIFLQVFWRCRKKAISHRMQSTLRQIASIFKLIGQRLDENHENVNSLYKMKKKNYRGSLSETTVE